MQSIDIRRKFLDFFASKGHTAVGSASLVPADDPSLLFTNAGMVPFKDVFLGERRLSYGRAASCQKCMRVSGKHNDLENVGYTSRHHTFFEMLGNFSFGDYFKTEACAYAWELLTGVFGLDPARLWITVFEKDDEAEAIWRDRIGIAADRVVRCGEKDNFWAMGPTGPCGPCSEIHLDRGAHLNPAATHPGNDAGGERFMEIWNLVFMQYNRDPSGALAPLPKPSIDTGMGLERLASVLQGTASNYDTDLFQPIIRDTARRARLAYGADPDKDVSLRVIADHARAGAFLVADGVVPENEGRGYVLRRILRRAIRHGRRLGFAEPFLFHACDAVVQHMGEVYPELAKARGYLGEVIANEERHFLTTLDRGIGLLEEEAGRLKAAGRRALDGETAFKLYDTYGFPLDLTEVVLQEQGLEVDRVGFDAALARQREMSRAGSNIGKLGADKPLYDRIAAEGIATRFIGYDRLEGRAPLRKLLVQGTFAAAAEAGQTVEIVTDETPFYAESGGQVGDRGSVRTATGEGEVLDVRKPLPSLWTHTVKVLRGALKEGQPAEWAVQAERRRAVMAHHSATHLLHAALHQRLGGHIKQAGSLVAPTHLRFDFHHMSALSPEEIADVEQQVHRAILANVPVDKRIMGLKEAIASGATAFFDEKYGEEVRVVAMGGFSKELCGGTHVDRTGDIGSLLIVKEEAVAAGIRRIEAVAGLEAFRRMQQQRDALRNLSQVAGVPAEKVADQLTALRARLKELEKENRRRTTEGAAFSIDGLLARAREKDGVRRLFAEVDTGEDPDAFRQIGDTVRDKLGRGLAMLAAPGGGKIRLLILVDPSLHERYKAGALMKEIAKAAGGSGGGRPDRAEGGVPDAEALKIALSRWEALVG